ncbi:fructokinase [Arcticibacter pallidicorallinus]|uniref:Fructokinase n=1 Tax=Arcticibacter pallidicorallinus TaxID=1259464 RepID=A0A2T0U8Z1_9SPHI|nr:carbohydrate kinase [Arcticibacter pallidicorallinus]PRY54342.1 fructokinase [Arcticibacter pallidicorallinus]
MLKAVCFGEILWDKFKDQRRAGGAPMNVALHLHKQGINCGLISSVGDDNAGRELLEVMANQGFATDLVQKHPALPTGIVEVELDEKQQATYTIVEPVAWDDIAATKDGKKATAEAEVLIYGSLACRNTASRSALLTLLPLAKKRILDLNLRAPHYSATVLRELIESADVLKINEDELTYLANLYPISAPDIEGQVYQLSAETDTPLICVTLGDKGAMVLHDGAIYRHEGFKVEVADTVGAGDSFLATFINGLLKKLPIDKILHNACAVGAFVASKHGANPEYSLEGIEGVDFYTR